MAHNGGAKIRSVKGRNNRKPSGKNRNNWVLHKEARKLRIARRLARRSKLRKEAT